MACTSLLTVSSFFFCGFLRRSSTPAGFPDHGLHPMARQGQLPACRCRSDLRWQPHSQQCFFFRKQARRGLKCRIAAACIIFSAGDSDIPDHPFAAGHFFRLNGIFPLLQSAFAGTFHIRHGRNWAKSLQRAGTRVSTLFMGCSLFILIFAFLLPSCYGIFPDSWHGQLFWHNLRVLLRRTAGLHDLLSKS